MTLGNVASPRSGGGHSPTGLSSLTMATNNLTNNQERHSNPPASQFQMMANAMDPTHGHLKAATTHNTNPNHFSNLQPAPI